MDVFRPFRPQSNYGSPGYGMYPGTPGTYMNGLGDIVMEPGANYGAWGYQPGGGQHTPYGSRGYGIYGLGAGFTMPPAIEGLSTPAKLGAGAALGALLGLGAGFLLWGR